MVFNNNSNIAEIMRPLFVTEDIHVHVACDLQTVVEMLRTTDVQMVLMDVESREGDWLHGIELITYIREQSSIPIMVVSTQAAEEVKIMALDAGADDYVVWGCNPLEILARVNSQLRRYMQLKNVCANIDRIYRVGDLEINDRNRTVTVDSREVRLTPIEYKILRLLVQQRGKVLSISQIYESIWHMQAIGVDNTVAVHIRHIREKIECNPKKPRYLKVVWGNGYKVG
ncbi:MAG: response regulator transcription factor [Lachnospiraceae bacterium]|nr:response regulator transcription factor [Lachnospiraceae bacterium]